MLRPWVYVKIKNQHEEEGKLQKKVEEWLVLKVSHIQIYSKVVHIFFVQLLHVKM